MKVSIVKALDYDLSRIHQEIMDIKSNYPDQTQFLITSNDGHELFEGAGTEEYPEKFTKLNTFFTGTEISRIVNEFPEYYRWRILCLKPRKTYSIHKDSWKSGIKNYRLHIPVITNEQCYLMFFQNRISDKSGHTQIEYHHLETGKIYRVDTSGYHTAVNYHPSSDRIHIIAERFV